MKAVVWILSIVAGVLTAALVGAAIGFSKGFVKGAFGITIESGGWLTTLPAALAGILAMTNAASALDRWLQKRDRAKRTPE